jgi:hypothetical protein
MKLNYEKTTKDIEEARENWLKVINNKYDEVSDFVNGLTSDEIIESKIMSELIIPTAEFVEYRYSITMENNYLIDEYNNGKFTKHSLCKINHHLNRWEWCELLGAEPINWRFIPNSTVDGDATELTKENLMKDLSKYTSRFYSLKYHHLYQLNRTKWEFYIWYIKTRLKN